jgi:chemotaxis protein methyltransferase CheR
VREDQIREIEIDLLLEGVYRRYGHDLRGYSRSHLERRLNWSLAGSGCKSISELIPKVLRDESFFARLLLSFSITVTEMFRVPAAYRVLREKVMPVLRTFPFIRVWIAGCATGEEAYSAAILLKEEGLYGRANIFATDFNDIALQKAKDGIYPLEEMKRYTANYHQSGGLHSFADYYHAYCGAAAMDSGLKENITFANHNLATDGVFSEMHLIMCRNVLIYFDKPLKTRALGLFCDSLIRGGFLCLGDRETLSFSSVYDYFKPVDEHWKIYRKAA